MLPAVLLAVPTVLAGLGVLTDVGGGLSWLLLAVLAAFFGGINQAWVLLVEILR